MATYCYLFSMILPYTNQAYGPFVVQQPSLAAWSSSQLMLRLGTVASFRWKVQKSRATQIPLSIFQKGQLLAQNAGSREKKKITAFEMYFLGPKTLERPRPDCARVPTPNPVSATESDSQPQRFSPFSLWNRGCEPQDNATELPANRKPLWNRFCLVLACRPQSQSGPLPIERRRFAIPPFFCYCFSFFTRCVIVRYFFLLRIHRNQF